MGVVAAVRLVHADYHGGGQLRSGAAGHLPYPVAHRPEFDGCRLVDVLPANLRWCVKNNEMDLIVERTERVLGTEIIKFVFVMCCVGQTGGGNSLQLWYVQLLFILPLVRVLAALALQVAVGALEVFCPFASFARTRIISTNHQMCMTCRTINKHIK